MNKKTIMNLLQSFKQYISKENLFSQKDHLLVAVSGGADSVVLCYLCKAAGYKFSIAHCNFQLRNEESDEDENFVKALGVHLDVPVYTKKFDTKKYAADKKLSIQVAARDLRYNWFAGIMHQMNVGSKNDDQFSIQHISKVLTAHHADDNIETILMNFFKGSGINGLKGILAKQEHIIRPLLFATKEEILAYALHNNISYREDSSNSSDKYTRNYFRNQLIPGLQKVFPAVKENLMHNAERFKEINEIYNAAIEKTKQTLLFKVGNEFHLPVLKLQKTTGLTTILYEWLKGFNFSPGQISDIIHLLNSDSGKYVQSGTHRILRNRKWLIISPLSATDNSVYLLSDTSGEVVFPAGKLTLQHKVPADKIDTSPAVAQLAAKDIRFPLIIRKWKQGDYFYPLGMQKKKKLSRFFIDQKLSLNQKENVWIVESDQQIVWVIGLRIDKRFRLTPSTSAVIKLSFLPS